MEPNPDQAICSLFQEWGESLFRHAFRLTRSHETADDLVQEAFLSLYMEFRRGRQMTNPRAWMLGLVSHKAARIHRDLHRWAADQRMVEDLAAPENGGVEFWDVPDDELIPLLKPLSAREAEVVLLRLQSLKYREIAQQLGISHKSVATLLARALAKMQHSAERVKASRRGLVNWRPDAASFQ
jgi:RNA polymerase sigma factor (sigma-70 family)